ncbi:type II toxin-antitoxin system YafO family toxin [Pluralibacter gergoviae]
MPNEYQGKVLPGRFRKDVDLDKFVDPFKEHFRYGHHKQFGKDTLFGEPDEVLEYHLRKVHIDLGNYSDQHAESSTELCWKNWASGKVDKATGKRKQTPASDVYLIYLVTSERNAFLLDFWGPPSSAHRKAKEDEQMQKLISECDRILRLKGLQSMPRDAELWGPEFLV